MSLPTQESQEILKVLQEYVLGDIKYTGVGLCSNIYRGLSCNRNEDLVEEWLYDSFKVWPEFSGDLDYPISVTDQDPEVQYCCTKDKTVGEYGAARKRLAEFLITRLA